MATKIKICGMRRLEDVDLVNELKPDYAGVVLCRRFWRGIDFEQAKVLRARLDPAIPMVGLFVNDKFMDVAVALRQNVVDMVQLQGTESEEYIRNLKYLCGSKPVIKAVQVSGVAEIRSAEKSVEADHLMLGTGTGETFDWSLAKDLKRPFILSGGLTAENVTEAMETLHPWGVDFFNGLETNGVIDGAKVRKAVAAVRRFDQEHSKTGAVITTKK